MIISISIFNETLNQGFIILFKKLSEYKVIIVYSAKMCTSYILKYMYLFKQTFSLDKHFYDCPKL